MNNQNTAQSFGKFYKMATCSVINLLVVGSNPGRVT